MGNVKHHNGERARDRQADYPDPPFIAAPNRLYLGNFLATFSLCYIFPGRGASRGREFSLLKAQNLKNYNEPQALVSGVSKMEVKELIRECVVFIGKYNHHKKEPEPIGTGFLLCQNSSTHPSDSRGYLVTAKHVIQQPYQRLGVNEFLIRLNLRGGNAVWLTQPIHYEEWVFHQDGQTDLAVCSVELSREFDHRAYPINDRVEHPNAPDGSEMDRPSFGTEVFTIGLFWPRPGKFRALPIVRVGHIAALNEEPVLVSKCGEQDAYLISTDSFHGLSGSPVFWWSSRIQVYHGYSKVERYFHLLGVNVAHFNSPGPLTPEMQESINAGIAVVISKPKIIEMIEFHAKMDLNFHRIEHGGENLVQPTRLPEGLNCDSDPASTDFTLNELR